MRFRTILFTALLATPVAAQTVLEKTMADLESQHKAVRESISQLREHEANPPSGFVAAVLGDSNPDQRRYRADLALRAQNMQGAEQRYREALSAELIARTHAMKHADRGRYVQQRAAEAWQRYSQRRASLRHSLAQGLQFAGSDADRRRERVFAESMLRTARLEWEMTQAAMRRLNGRGDTQRLSRLMHRAAVVNEKVYAFNLDENRRSSEHVEAETLLRRLDRDYDIEEYRRLARTGRIGNDATGTLRERMARDAERALIAQLNKKALRSSRYDILRFMASDDTRITDAKKIEGEVRSTPEYAALDWLSPGTSRASPEYFQALALAVRRQEEGVDAWRAKFVPDAYVRTGVTALDELQAKFRTGAGKAHQVAGTAGDASLARVDARIARYHREADAAASALAAAGRIKDPRQLPVDQQRLLRAYGYIQGQGRNMRYAVPTGRRQLAGLESDVSLPGASLLDLISGENATKLLISTVAPQAAAGRVGTLIRGLGASERAAASTTAVADVLVGMGTDAAFEYAEKGKVDWGRLTLDSTLLRAGLGRAGLGTDALARSLAKRFSNPAVRRKAVAFLENSLGIAGEATLQSYYQSKMDGTGMSYEAFLSNLVNGAMARGFASAANREEATPTWLKKELATKGDDGVLLQTHFDRRQKQLDAAVAHAEGRFRAIAGEHALTKWPKDIGLGDILNFRRDGLTREKVARRVSEALETGRLSWPELKLLYAKNPHLKPLMAAVNERRNQLFTGLVGEAQDAARADVEAEFRVRKQRLEESLATHPDQLREALAANRRWRKSELDNVELPPIAPGSDNLTSDIDRSVQNERVRRYLKALYRSRAGGDGEPATSARSYDVNEYINLFPTINDTMPISREIAEVKVKEGVFRSLDHGQAVEANAMAAAMLHMTPQQRARYKQNVLRRARSADALRLTQRQLSAADVSLAKAEREMAAEIARLKQERPELAEQGADLALLARDNLYGKRTEAIREKQVRVEELGARIDEAAGKSDDGRRLLGERERVAAELRKVLLAKAKPKVFRPLQQRLVQLNQRVAAEAARTDDGKRLVGNRNRLAAEIQRDWGLTLREGIETYASFSGLNTVVNEGQLAGREMRDLINDKGFTRESLGYSERQVRNMLDDQVMMMTHHMNGFHEGHEGAVDAASAMGKYAERAVLALKLSGVDLSKPPYRKLSEWSEKLVRNRKDAEDLKKTLMDLGEESSGVRDMDAGLLALSGMVMDAVPNAKGLFDPDLIVPPKSGTPAAEAAEMRRWRAEVASRRGVNREDARIAALQGPASAAAHHVERIDAIDGELADLTAERDRRAELRRKYRRADWPGVEKKLAAREELNQRIAALRSLGAPGAEVRKLMQEGWKLDAELRELEVPGGAKLAPDAEDRRIDRRIAALEAERLNRQTLVARREREAEGENQRLRNAPAFADGVAPIEVLEPVTVVPGGKISVRIGETVVTISVREAKEKP